MKPTAGGMPINAPRRLGNSGGNPVRAGVGETILALNKTLERIDDQSCLLRNSSLRHLTEEKLRKLINSL